MERTIPNRAWSQSQPTKPVQQNIKVAQPSTIREAMSNENKETNTGTVEFSELVSGEISEAEREEIMAEVVKQKMNMMESAIFPEELASTTVSGPQPKNPEADAISAALFGSGSDSVLEEERKLRLMKQQRAIQSGSGGFCRGD